MTTTYRTANNMTGARLNLSRFVVDKATEAAKKAKVRWIGTRIAPNTYPALRAAFDHAKRTGEALPISNQYCEDTIYTEPEHNVAFRAWHDLTHLATGLSFSLPDEWELALLHLDELERAGLGPDTTEYQLLRADVLGPVVLLGINREYPINQGEFGRYCAEVGFDQGILAELRRLPEAQVA